jgi:hypothetical protein
MSFLVLKRGSVVDCSGPYPKISELIVRDVAESLQTQKRFLGHLPKALTVCEHSVLVAEALYFAYCDPRLSLLGLVHDASEAILGDVPGPVKGYCRDYQKIEDLVQDQILEFWQIPEPTPWEEQTIKDFDRAALWLEVPDQEPWASWKLANPVSDAALKCVYEVFPVVDKLTYPDRYFEHLFTKWIKEVRS